MIKKAIVMAIVLCFTMVMLIGCTGAGTPANPDADNENVVKVAFSLDQMSEGNAIVNQGMNDWVDEYNASHEQQVELTIFDANAKVEKQISDVETIIADGYDVMVFSCVDADGSLPAMEAASKAGIKIVDIRDMKSGLADVVMNMQDEGVMTDNLRGWMQAHLDEDPDLIWNVGIIYGAAAQTLQLERGDFLKRWAEDEDRVNIVVDAYGDWDTQKSMAITEDWLQVYDDINIIVAANIGEAQGVSAALQAANLKDKIKVITFDITDDTVLNIRDGVIDASVGCHLHECGVGYIKMAVELYNGEFTDAEYINKDVIIVDTTNYEDFLAA